MTTLHVTGDLDDLIALAETATAREGSTRTEDRLVMEAFRAAWTPSACAEVGRKLREATATPETAKKAANKKAPKAA